MAPINKLADRPPAPEEIVGLLADPLRRKVVALLDGVERSAEEMVALTGSNTRSVFEQLGRLPSAGIVRSAGDRYVLIDDVFSRSVRAAAAQRLARSMTSTPSWLVGISTATGSSRCRRNHGQ